MKANKVLRFIGEQVLTMAEAAVVYVMFDKVTEVIENRKNKKVVEEDDDDFYDLDDEEI